MPAGATTTSTREPARAAIPRLLETHGAKIHGLALRLCRNRADADELVQDVFMQAFRKWDQFESRSDPGTWLYTIAVRACHRKMRRRSGQPRHMASLSELMPFRDRAVADVNGDSPPDRAVRRETQDAVREAIATLPEAFRVPLVLKDMLELPVEEVAAALAIKPQTVKTRVHRARLRLRQALMRRVPLRPAPAPIYERQVCLDLLKAKLDAMDHGRGFPIGQDVICDRCQSVFRELDLTQEACATLAEGQIPTAVRRRIAAMLDGRPAKNGRARAPRRRAAPRP